MTSQIAFIIGAAVGFPIGCMIGTFIYYRVKFRSWCRLVHRHTGQWSERRAGYGGSRHWHRVY